MTSRCAATTRAGGRCQAHPGRDGFCVFHSPTHAEARAIGHRLGGERHRVPHAGDADALPKKIRTLEDVLGLLDYGVAEMLPMENSGERGRLIVALAHAYSEAIKAGELEQRVAALEQIVLERRQAA